MTEPAATITTLRSALAAGTLRPSELAVQSLARANGNSGRNTYLWRDPAWTMAEAARAEAMPRTDGGPFGDGRSPLWGLPISAKDCFDLAGAPTTCGVQFYRDLNGPAQQDSWLVKQLRAAGAVLTGKTHLHPLAYGITGENPEFGDCQQPGNHGALTGGSSSGAAASVLEGSAVAAIGTDTGGSIRVPAALCGLTGYRASLDRGHWRGAAHLAPSFDTMGWLFRHLEDAPLFSSPLAPRQLPAPRTFTRFAVVAPSFLHDCEPAILQSLNALAGELQALGLESTTIDVDWWNEAFEIYAPLQAWEASCVHVGHFHQFAPELCQRLEWGARVTEEERAPLRKRQDDYVERMDALFAEHQLLLLPASPVAQLAFGADHSQTRRRLLRYTTPFSLAGVPVVTVPCATGGMQLAAARDHDESLLALAAQLGRQRHAASHLNL